jgi:hypothetical protein
MITPRMFDVPIITPLEVGGLHDRIFTAQERSRTGHPVCLSFVNALRSPGTRGSGPAVGKRTNPAFPFKAA